MAEASAPQKEYKRPGFIRRFFTRIFVTIGVLTTLSIAMLVFSISQVTDYIPEPLPEKIVLTYTLKEGLAEAGGKPSLSQPLLKAPVTLRNVVEALQDATKDEHVKGFVAQMQDVSLSAAQIQELRDAVLAFRKAGKFAYIYGDSFGGFSPGMSDYYFATAFDQIWLSPIGVVGVNGVAAEVPFAREVLDKVGITPQFSHKGIYKSASESLTETQMSAPNREATEDLVNDLFDQMVKGCAAGRNIPEAEFLKIVDNGPYTDHEALSLKLVDHVASYDELVDEVKKKADLGNTKPVDLIKYASRNDSSAPEIPAFLKKYQKQDEQKPTQSHKIALIYGVGEIVSYKSSHGTFGEGGMSAERTIESFREAEKDNDVAAIVLRLDSPGGSPQASEAIRRVMMEARKKGKPVVVSMGGAAASGGYWISTGANKIVAQPATITGSIGVFGGKLVTLPLWGKIGVNWVGIKRGEKALMWSSTSPFSDAEYAKFDALLGDTYEAFLQRVMEGRKLTHEQAEAVAEGRVWTGREARDKGLVDELGGLDRAIELAKIEAKLDLKKDIPVKEFPEPKTTLEEFVSMMGGESAYMLPGLSTEDLLKQFSRLNGLSTQGMLLAPVMQIH